MRRERCREKGKKEEKKLALSTFLFPSSFPTPSPRFRPFQPLAQSRSRSRTMSASTLRASGACAVQRRNVSAVAGSPSANVVAAAPAPRPRSSAVAAALAAAPSIASVNAVRRLTSSSRASVAARAAVRDGASLDGRKLRVAVIGGGPSGACAAETLAKGGVEAFLIERKMDNCKV